MSPSPSAPDLEGLTALSLVAAVALALSLPARASGQDLQPGEVVVDRVVAVVEGARGASKTSRVVTLFELRTEARLVLAERTRRLDAAALEPPASLLQAVLRSVVEQLLIEAEASRLQTAPPSAEAIAGERRRLETRLGGPGGLERFAELASAPIDLLEAIVVRRATVERFVSGSVALAVRVTAEDVERAHATGDHPFGERPLEEVRDEIEAFLVARMQRQRLAAWVEELRRRSAVRVIAP